MKQDATEQDRAIKISVNALGGQGGGVLAGWIVKLAEKAGYIAQSTSVPGVAQRTGATIYYVELFPEAAAQRAGKTPVLALMPTPGDVDVVIASEMMEAGRAVMRGFVSKRTTLIASSHRVYAIGEKIEMGDGRQSGETIMDAARNAAGRFVVADMQEAAAKAGSVISAVLFGALAGSGALPIERELFEETIRDSKRAVEGNLAAFALGFEAAQAAPQAAPAQATEERKANAPARAVAPLLQRMNGFPATAHFYMHEGLKKTVDYQDARYGALYLDRLEKVRALDEAHGGARRDWALLKAVAKHLALWMTYEDAIRVADLKTRASRFERCRDDVRAADGQIVHVSEYMHPRVEEVCDLLPPPLARSILNTPALSRPLQRLLGDGRRVSTTKMRGFFMLNMLGSLRFMRRASYRYVLEEGRIGAWLALVEDASATDYALACEIAGLQRLIKGYGETHERGLANYARVTDALDRVKAQPDPAASLRVLRDAALKDEDGVALQGAMSKLNKVSQAA